MRKLDLTQKKIKHGEGDGEELKSGGKGTLKAKDKVTIV